MAAADRSRPYPEIGGFMVCRRSGAGGSIATPGSSRAISRLMNSYAIIDISFQLMHSMGKEQHTNLKTGMMNRKHRMASVSEGDGDLAMRPSLRLIPSEGMAPIRKDIRARACHRIQQTPPRFVRSDFRF